MFSPDERWITRGYRANRGTFPIINRGDVYRPIAVWQRSDGRLLREVNRHLDGTHVVFWMPDGRRLISAGNDGWIRFWDMPPTDPRWPHGLALLWLALFLGYRVWERRKRRRAVREAHAANPDTLDERPDIDR